MLDLKRADEITEDKAVNQLRQTTDAYTTRADSPHVEKHLGVVQTAEQSPRMEVQHAEVLVQTVEVRLSE